jgi:threonyl-tRNA synthetase
MFTSVFRQASKRVGDDKIWDKAEAALLKAIKKSKLKYEINKGDGCFLWTKNRFCTSRFHWT